MKYLLLNLILLSIFIGVCSAQNLVPNPSFEDTISCPQTQMEIDKAMYWNSYKNSPDYFNACSPIQYIGNSNIGVSVPSNFLGYQKPYNGNAYCGIAEQSPDISANIIREFIGARLIGPLVIGIRYYVSFKVSLADSSLYACDKLGVQFSTLPFIDSLQSGDEKSFPINNHAQVYADYIIADTNRWVTISGSFIADSAYKYIVIGNFFSDSLTSCINTMNSIDHVAYYYIDEVCVTADSLACNFGNDGINMTENERLSIYPNPASNKIYIHSKYKSLYNCTLTNLLGKEIRSYKSSGVSDIDISDLPNGIYLLTINYLNQIIQKKQIIIH